MEREPRILRTLGVEPEPIQRVELAVSHSGRSVADRFKQGVDNASVERNRPGGSIGEARFGGTERRGRPPNISGGADSCRPGADGGSVAEVLRRSSEGVGRAVGGTGTGGHCGIGDRSEER